MLQTVLGIKIGPQGPKNEEKKTPQLSGYDLQVKNVAPKVATKSEVFLKRFIKASEKSRKIWFAFYFTSSFVLRYYQIEIDIH